MVVEYLLRRILQIVKRKIRIYSCTHQCSSGLLEFNNNFDKMYSDFREISDILKGGENALYETLEELNEDIGLRVEL